MGSPPAGYTVRDQTEVILTNCGQYTVEVVTVSLSLFLGALQGLEIYKIVSSTLWWATEGSRYVLYERSLLGGSWVGGRLAEVGL